MVVTVREGWENQSNEERNRENISEHERVREILSLRATKSEHVAQEHSSHFGTLSTATPTTIPNSRGGDTLCVNARSRADMAQRVRSAEY